MENLFWHINLAEKPTCHYIGTGISEEHHNRIYCLPNLWCLHLYDFEGTLTMEEGCLDVHPGDIGFIPPGKTVTYAVYGTGVHLACHFYMGGGSRPPRTLPAMMPSGALYPEFSEAFRKILHLHAASPFAADIKLWDVLLDAERMGQRVQQRENALHPALEKCLQYIELNLAAKLSVAELIGLAGVSHPYLVRLFKEHQDCTITEYIQQRRMTKARHLLTETDQPVKSVAIDCGFTDLQYFNKCVRKAFGISPRAMRG
ncbi:HTH-type transcriptional activator Btr [Pontiella desulfatans]|uniref:HTH-type transcriptional activator Btr n=1 Tax=Pontiella desulfatans TaxID=2750659 RepID=A0A6C2TX72_PONDE|nr:AraC family transcriptional regulator [Pontiella desulfatans]VGO11906.1 HTH-type transcriptional activator Btr [Pontiella desulfatans]